MDTLQSFTSITVGVQRMDRRGGEEEEEEERRVEEKIGKWERRKMRREEMR